MILTSGIIAGTFAIAAGTATPLQPMNVTRLRNRVTKVYAGNDMTILLSHTDNFEIISYTKYKVLTANDNKSNIDIKVKKGQTIYIDSQTGYTDDFYNIGNHLIDVKEG